MSAAYAVKPGSIADYPIARYSTTDHSTGNRAVDSRVTRAHLCIVDAAAGASDTFASTGRAAVPPAHTTHLRLTRRGRVVFTTLAAVPLVLGAIAIAVNGGMAAAEDTAGAGAIAFQYVTVEAGQSLWQLAEKVAPAQDPRDVIADIVNLNQLSSEAVQPGQRLALPADY